MVWAAGARAAGLADGLELERASLGRIRVRGTLQVPGHDEVYVIGDAAHLDDESIPMMAQPAMQEGKRAARNIRLALAGEPAQAFRYRDPGSLATIGRNQAVARLGRFEFTGFVAWVLWLVVHLVYLIGFRSRLLVLINWAWDYFLYERAVRLITTEQLGPPDSP